MRDILKPLVVLVMLITLFEKLVPQGRMKEAGKTGLGLIMLFMLATLLSETAHVAAFEQSAPTDIFQSEKPLAQDAYLSAALDSAARSLSLAAQNALEAAGYADTEVRVALDAKGKINACYLAATDPVAIKIIAEALEIKSTLIFPLKEAEGEYGA
jgi:hypothetical protein